MPSQHMCLCRTCWLHFCPRTAQVGLTEAGTQAAHQHWNNEVAKWVSDSLTDQVANADDSCSSGTLVDRAAAEAVRIFADEMLLHLCASVDELSALLNVCQCFARLICCHACLPCARS